MNRFGVLLVLLVIGSTLLNTNPYLLFHTPLAILLGLVQPTTLFPALVLVISRIRKVDGFKTGTYVISATLVGSALVSVIPVFFHQLLVLQSSTTNTFAWPNSLSYNLTISYLTCLFFSIVIFGLRGVVMAIRSDKVRLSYVDKAVLAVSVLVFVFIHGSNLKKVYTYEQGWKSDIAFIDSLKSLKVQDIDKESLIKACKNLNFGYRRSECFMNVAKVTGDVGICQNIQLLESTPAFSVESCIKNSKITAGDLSFCSSLADDSRDICFIHFAKENPQDAKDGKVCDLVSQKDMCLTEIATRLKDITMCSQTTEIDHCRFNVNLQFAIDANDWEFCSRETVGWNSETRASCYSLFTYGPEDKVICDGMVTGPNKLDEIDRSVCYFRLRRLTNDPTLCNSIKQDYIKSSCVTNSPNDHFSERDRNQLYFFDTDL